MTPPPRKGAARSRPAPLKRPPAPKAQRRALCLALSFVLLPCLLLPEGFGLDLVTSNRPLLSLALCCLPACQSPKAFQTNPESPLN